MTTTKKKDPTVYSKLETELNKKYGNIIRPSSFVKDEEQTIFSLTPQLDIALNGGIPTKSWCIFSGIEKFGKTTLALMLAAQFQKAGRKAYYGDFEYRWKVVNAYGIEGFDPEKMLVIRSFDSAKVLTAEEKLYILLQLMKDKENKGSLFIIDSTSAICPENVSTSGDVSGSRRSTSPKLLTDFFKQAAPYVQLNDLTVVCISHLITNTSGYGAKYMEDGGLYMKYQCDVHLRGTQKPKNIIDKNGKEVGQEPIWDIVVSALGPPRSKIKTNMIYGLGYDKVTEYIELATDLDIINKGGSWYTYGDHKIQGIEGLASIFRDDPELFSQLEKDVKKELSGI